MKNNDLAIPYLVRQLVKNKLIQEIVFDLYKAKTSKDSVETFLYIANERFNKIAEDPEHEGIEGFFEKVWGNVEDSVFLNHLSELGAIKDTEYFIREDDEFSIKVKVNSPEYIKHLYGWIKEADHILNYGIFSLHTFTGEAYCLDNQYVFDTNDGLFRIFKAFLLEPKHILSHKQINDIFKNDHFEEPDPLVVQQAIYKIKKKLNMEGELKKLFLSSDKEYFLRQS